MGKVPGTTAQHQAMRDARKLIERELRLRKRSRRLRAARPKR